MTDAFKEKDKKSKKNYKIIITLCQMMIDRGYEAAKLNLEEYLQLGQQEYILRQRQKLRQDIMIFKKKTKSGEEKNLCVFFHNEVQGKSKKFQKDDFKTYLDHAKRSESPHLMIILEGDPNNSQVVNPDTKKIIDESSNSSIDFFVELFNEDDLVVNITRHQLVPKHYPMNEDEKIELKKKYQIELSQLPKILLTDPVSRYFGMRRGDVFKIIRDSETAGKYVTYRCVI